MLPFCRGAMVRFKNEKYFLKGKNGVRIFDVYGTVERFWWKINNKKKMIITKLLVEKLYPFEYVEVYPEEIELYNWQKRSKTC